MRPFCVSGPAVAGCCTGSVGEQVAQARVLSQLQQRQHVPRAGPYPLVPPAPHGLGMDVETAVQLRSRLLPETARAAAGSRRGIRRCFSCNGCAIAASSRVLQEDSRPLYPRSGSPNLPTTALCVPFYAVFFVARSPFGFRSQLCVLSAPTARRQVTQPG